MEQANIAMLSAFQDAYIKLAESSINALEQIPGALDQGSPKHGKAVVALLQLGAALEESRETIKKALADNESR